jgi:enamine deaminase RidA (YjgF/YER057c/UK114 family)
MDPHPISVDYLTPAQLPAVSDPWWVSVLGLTEFGRQPSAAVPDSVPTARVRMTPLDTVQNLCEVWHAAATLRCGRLGAVKYRANDQILFGCLEVPESDSPLIQRAEHRGSLHEATMQAYRDIFQTLDTTRFKQLLRIWHYVPAINERDDDGERYWQFNTARHESFLARRQAIDHSVPAASALGTPGGSPLVIYFLASATAIRTFENPRQVNAYRYPKQYGPSSPIFSRAALLTETSASPLLVSGTASIVGHETVHTDDVAAQTRETLVNIRALLNHANQSLGHERFDIEHLAYKVYVRRADDLTRIAAAMRDTVGGIGRAAFLHAEVCRRELLVEIEAVASSAEARRA